jgi:BTB/POZ domain
MRICMFLLRRGADPTARAVNVLIDFRPPLPGMYAVISTPVSIMSYLFDQHEIESEDEPIVKLFTKQRELLGNAVKGWERRALSSASLPENIQRVLDNFRLCPNNDRMTFVCSDGVNIESYRSVLSLYSPVFKTYFDGPWSKTHPDGQWETAYPSHLINFLLDYMYTGKIDNSYVSNNCNIVYTAAHEFQLEPLLNKARYGMLDGVSCDNIKSTLESAYLYSDEDLLNVCYEFVRVNLDVVMPEPAFAALSLEQPDLWEGLFRYLRPGKPYVKYDPEGSSRKKRASEGGEEQEGGKKARQSESTAVGCRTGEASPEKA